MITDAPRRSTAGRMSAAQAAQVQRGVDPALAMPRAASVIVELADVIDVADRDGTHAGVHASIPAGTPNPSPDSDVEGLTPLFQPLEAQGFRDAWGTVQVGFVDDPQGAVHQADELVTQVMQSLGESFAGERARLDGQARTGPASTEDLRIALRRYRSLLQRLLAF
jgi:hypothetical protein